MTYWFGHRALMLGLCVGGALLASGCAEHDELDTSAVPLDAIEHRRVSVLDDEAEGRKHFHAGRYGNAEKHFRAAVEANPGNSAAWVGLAASYDQLRRFDLAERAYHRAMDIEGRTATLLNNLGYHYLLQGKKDRARHNFQAAAQLEPNNPRIQANLRLLETGQYETASR